MSSRAPDSTLPWAIGVGDVGVSESQLQGGVAFPLVGEAVDVVQGGRVGAAVVGEELERASGLYRRQLGPVADEQHLRPDLAGVGGDVVQVLGGGQGRFVDDDQLPPPQ